jgi:microcystin degradation protein MlrC
MDEKEPKRVARVAVASFEFEGNSFSPVVCGREQFGLRSEGELVWRAIEGRSIAVSGGVDVLREAHDLEIVPILIAQGGSGGSVESQYFHETVDAIVEGLRDQGPFDGIYLALHGAMVSEGVSDAEGFLLEAIRRETGHAAVIAVSLDLHAHVTAAMVCHAQILVGYENYPHDDAYTTGRRACALLVETLRGRIRPVMHMARLDMLVPVPGGSTLDPAAPLARVKKLARSLETGAVVSTSYFTCQPWLDDDSAGNVALAITHDDPVLAEKTARRIAEELWSLREAFELPLLPVEAAIREALAARVKPAILADTGDSVGAGSAGDSSFVLTQLLKFAPQHRCAVSLVDPGVAAKAIESGPGATLKIALGFALDPRHGEPLMLSAEVVSVHDGKFAYSAGPFAGVEGDMGPCAVLAVGGHRILVASRGTYEYADEHYRAMGIEPKAFDIVVLKNGMNFRNLLREGTTWVLVDSVGSSSANLASLPWTNRPSPFWPRDRDLRKPC